MIIVHGMLPVKPEELEHAMDMARRMAAATQTEPGCVSYDFYVGLSDPHTLMLFQEWENMEALMGHFETPHMEEFLRDLPEVLDGEITTRRYSVQSVDADEDETITDDVEAPPIIH